MDFDVTTAAHRALGAMVRLAQPDGRALDFTPGEALILSRALVAVRDGISSERQIYMSPIASDEAFFAEHAEDGLKVAGQVLAWPQVTRLADLLARAAGGLGVDAR